MCYEDLANAIVQKAATDYREACERVRNGDETALRQVKECERFFKSNWGDLLCKGKAQYIFDRLKAEQEGKTPKQKQRKFSLKR